MKKEDFALLLKDLYQLYNPSFLEHIPTLVERYSRMEVDAVKTAILKYNRKSASFYDPEKDKDEYAINLVKEYSNGNRLLYGVKLEEIKPAEVILQNNKIEENVNKRIEEIHNEISSKEKEIVKDYENKLKNLTEEIGNLKSKQNDNLDVRLIVNYTEHELKLPNKEIILSLGVGARLITTSIEGNKIVALKIVDIMCDGVSDLDGKLIIEIILDRE